MYNRMERTGGILEKISDIVDYAGKHYSYLSITLYAAYIVVFLGVVNFNPAYITDLKLLMQVNCQATDQAVTFGDAKSPKKTQTVEDLQKKNSTPSIRTLQDGQFNDYCRSKKTI